jgi:hypothetical protein
MNRMRIRHVLAVMLLVGCGAGSPVDPTSLDSADYVLTTDRASYVAVGEGTAPWRSYHFTVVATFTNRGPTTVFLENCGPASTHPTYSLSDDGPGVSGYAPNWACAGHNAQLAVRPGMTRTDTLAIFGPTAVDGVTKEPLGSLAGVKRLHYFVQACRGAGECGIPGSGVSEPFTVSVAP